MKNILDEYYLNKIHNFLVGNSIQPIFPVIMGNFLTMAIILKKSIIFALIELYTKYIKL
jgi:hypothetical protein